MLRVTPEITAPLGSRTVPVTLAVGVWAQATPRERKNNTRLQPKAEPVSFAKTEMRRLLIIRSSRLSMDRNPGNSVTPPAWTTNTFSPWNVLKAKPVRRQCRSQNDSDQKGLDCRALD